MTQETCGLIPFFLANYRVLADFDERFLGRDDDETSLSDFLYLADHAATGDDIVVDLEIRNHLLKLLLLFLLWSENQEVEDEKDKNNRGESEKPESVLLTSLKEKKIIHFVYLFFFWINSNEDRSFNSLPTIVALFQFRKKISAKLSEFAKLDSLPNLSHGVKEEG